MPILPEELFPAIAWRAGRGSARRARARERDEAGKRGVSNAMRKTRPGVVASEVASEHVFDQSRGGSCRRMAEPDRREHLVAVLDERGLPRVPLRMSCPASQGGIGGMPAQNRQAGTPRLVTGPRQSPRVGTPVPVTPFPRHSPSHATTGA